MGRCPPPDCTRVVVANLLLEDSATARSLHSSNPHPHPHPNPNPTPTPHPLTLTLTNPNPNLLLEDAVAQLRVADGRLVCGDHVARATWLGLGFGFGFGFGFGSGFEFGFGLG